MKAQRDRNHYASGHSTLRRRHKMSVELINAQCSTHQRRRRDLTRQLSLVGVARCVLGLSERSSDFSSVSRSLTTHWMSANRLKMNVDKTRLLSTLLQRTASPYKMAVFRLYGYIHEEVKAKPSPFGSKTQIVEV